MAKPEWGVKRICHSCGTRYYDMRREPPTCPKCNTEFDPEAFLKSRRSRSAAVEEMAATPARAKKKAEVVEDEEDVDVPETDEVELDAEEADDTETDDTADLVDDDLADDDDADALDDDGLDADTDDAADVLLEEDGDLGDDDVAVVVETDEDDDSR